jgi:hemin-degrading HemS/ChuX-like protein
MRRTLSSAALILLLTACSEAVDIPSGDAGAGGKSDGATSTASGGDPGEPLAVPVPATGRVFVQLDPLAIVTPKGDATASMGWDLAFEGFGAYTNSGPSGVGKGGAFGPLDLGVFDDGTLPEVPFLVQDATGGAFVHWYLYEGTSHALWSRFHVHGVRDGARLWKVQILGYYGDSNGAPVSALYQVRYAEVFDGSVGPTQTLTNLDGTAGGLDEPEPAPKAEVNDDAIDAVGVRAAWDAMTNTHEFFGLLRRFNMSRQQALRLGGEDRAHRVSVRSLALALGHAAEDEVPIMIFVGNRGVIQIHTGAIRNVQRMHGWLNVLDPRCNLHVREEGIAAAWVVRKPTSDGIVTSFELYDARGENVLLMFGKRKPGMVEDPRWRDLGAGLPGADAEATPTAPGAL